LSILVPGLQHTVSRSSAALHSFLGLFCGGMTLFLVAEVGKLAFGRLKVPLPAGTIVTAADSALHFEDESLAFEEIFSRDSDRILFRATTLKFQDKTFENVNASISMTTMDVAGTKYALSEIGAVEATTDLVIIPREAMGLGDAKLLAAIGAFLGWQATLFCIFASSVVGGLVSLALILAGRRDWQGKIPFGPYIALGAVLWIFFGQTLADWYVNLIKG
jgi:leader peptidase (prepilin peptidase)/N-methyltransferase